MKVEAKKARKTEATLKVLVLDKKTGKLPSVPFRFAMASNL